MNEKRIKLLIEELNKQIKGTDQMFLDGEDKSYIIGWLQGTIKTAIAELNSILEEQKQLNNIRIFKKKKGYEKIK